VGKENCIRAHSSSDPTRRAQPFSVGAFFRSRCIERKRSRRAIYCVSSRWVHSAGDANFSQHTIRSARMHSHNHFCVYIYRILLITSFSGEKNSFCGIFALRRTYRKSPKKISIRNGTFGFRRVQKRLKLLFAKKERQWGARCSFTKTRDIHIVINLHVLRAAEWLFM
jgi:hypothetical protein